MLAKILSFLGLDKAQVTDEQWDAEELETIRSVYSEADGSDIERIDHVDVFVNNQPIPFHTWPQYEVSLKFIRKVFDNKRSFRIPRVDSTIVDVRLLNETATLVAFFKAYPSAEYRDHHLAAKIEVRANDTLVPVVDWAKHLVTLDELKEVARTGKSKEFHDNQWIHVGLVPPK